MNPLRASAEAALVQATGAASVVRQCATCGSTGHGRPFLIGSDLHVSLAYAGDLAVIAWAAGPVGIDIEPSNAPVPPGLCVQEWTRLEALGKAAGTGLPRWPHTQPPPRPTQALDLPEGYVGTLAGTPIGWAVLSSR